MDSLCHFAPLHEPHCSLAVLRHRHSDLDALESCLCLFEADLDQDYCRHTYRKSLPSIICRQLFAVNHLPSILCRNLFAVNFLPSITSTISLLSMLILSSILCGLFWVVNSLLTPDQFKQNPRLDWTLPKCPICYWILLESLWSDALGVTVV